MQEKEIEIHGVNLVEFLGVNNEKLKSITAYYPKLKVISRGNILKVLGSEADILEFESKLELLIEHFNKFNSLSQGNIESVMEKGEEVVRGDASRDEIILYGNGGIKIKARTANQRKMVVELEKNDMMFAIGPAGTGKTYTAVALAVRALKNKEVKRIVLTRPAVEAGEHLGFLPGDLKEKLDPYLQPLYDALRDMIPQEKLADHVENGVIQIAPLAFMRGRTLDKAFVILDEAQNATEAQMKMFLTRMGQTAKFVITGDVTQVDLPKNQPSGLIRALKVLKKVEGIAMVELDGRDVIRHPLVKKVIKAFESNKS